VTPTVDLAVGRVMIEPLQTIEGDDEDKLSI
jgi:hypothetical protein